MIIYIVKRVTYEDSTILGVFECLADALIFSNTQMEEEATISCDGWVRYVCPMTGILVSSDLRIVDYFVNPKGSRVGVPTRYLDN